MLMKTDESRKNCYFYIAYGLLLLLAAFLRFIRIGDLPAGFHIDEAGMAYDAWSIAGFGVDRYLIHNPVYFINYGGGQNALYGYLTALLIRLFGYGPVTVRLPAAIWGMLGVVAISGIGKKLWGKSGMLLTAALAAVMPFYVMSSRFALESLLMLPMCALSLWSLMCAVEEKSRLSYLWYPFSGVLFGLTLYTYAVSYITLPIFLLLVFLYLICKKKTNLLKTLLFAIPLVLLALPLLLMVYINANDLPAIENAFFTIPRLTFYRGSEISWEKIRRGLWESWIHFFWKDTHDYNAISQVGPIYFVSVPFCILGLIVLIKKSFFEKRKHQGNPEENDARVLVILFFLAEYLMVVLTGDNINKANAAFLPLLLFTAGGLFFLWEKIRSFGKKAGNALVITCAVLYGISFSLFARIYYFTDYTDHMEYFTTSFSTVAEVLEEMPGQLQSRPIYLFENVMYYLMASPIEPWEVPDVVEGKTDVSIGNLHFYLPGTFDAGDVVILREDSDARSIWEDTERTGIAYDRLFLNGYVVYYKE